jgi:hypothetical protein
MAKRPGVTSVGTARDLAEKGLGYAANGIGEYSRHSAHSQNIKLPGYVEHGPKVRGPRAPGQLLGETIKALAKLERDARTERDLTRLAKLKKNIGIKSAFIARLGGNVEKQIRRIGSVVEAPEIMVSSAMTRPEQEFLSR